MLTNLNLLVLRCRDIDRARTFYELLGLTFQSEQHGKGSIHYSSADAAGVLELYPAKDALADQTGLGFCMENLEAVHENLRSTQFNPDDVRDTAWGRSFVVRDPDGRRVELKARQP